METKQVSYAENPLVELRVSEFTWQIFKKWLFRGFSTKWPLYLCLLSQTYQEGDLLYWLWKIIFNLKKKDGLVYFILQWMTIFLNKKAYHRTLYHNGRRATRNDYFSALWFVNWTYGPPKLLFTCLAFLITRVAHNPWCTISFFSFSCSTFKYLHVLSCSLMSKLSISALPWTPSPWLLLFLINNIKKSLKWHFVKWQMWCPNVPF